MKVEINTLYREIRDRLTSLYGAAEASAIAFALLEDKYGMTRTDVLCGKDKEFSAEEAQEYAEILEKLADGLPLQYATGRALFCDRYFKVTPATLIPRPETEQVPLLLPPMGGEHEASGRGIQALPLSGGVGGGLLLDCGTGTGCIAITIALDHPDWQVEAWDISQDALVVAQENAEMLGARNVSFKQKDILAEAASLHSSLSTFNSSPSTLHSSLLTFNYIISNPPYICDREAEDMESHVLDYEPHTALFVPDDDPLLFYRALAEIARVRLVPGGWLVVECNRAYTEETAALFRNYGLTNVEILPDCFDAPRFVRAQRG